MSDKFEVIIIGAGPGGSAVAYALAKKGINTLIIERGKYPGAKNMIGGRLYSYALNRLIPNFWKDAPVERKITQEKITVLCDKSSISLDFNSEELTNPPNSFTILRAKFDQWFANKAVDAGANLISNIRVDDLLWKEGKVSGIIAGPDKVEADIVIAADGAVSLMTEKAGLINFKKQNYSLGIKEIVELPEKTIEERFNITETEGVSQLLIGYCTKKIPGGAFIYTNKNSLSIGIILDINKLTEGKIEAHELMREFNLNPLIKKIIKDGKLAEYSAHVIPEMVKTKLYTDGMLVVGDAAGLLINSGITFRGMDMAIASGAAAAKTVEKALEKQDFSKKNLSYYEYLLKKDFVLKDAKTFKRMPGFLKNERLYTMYPEFACNLFKKLTIVNGEKKRIVNTIIEETKGKRLKIFKDFIEGLRSL